MLAGPRPTAAGSVSAAIGVGQPAAPLDLALAAHEVADARVVAMSADCVPIVAMQCEVPLMVDLARDL